ncbi:MAG: hypothetical protein GY953_38205, partial [bacterium]|nr:hypothetical protein [bacterium]
MFTRRSFLAGAAGASAFLPERSQVLKAYPQAASDFGKVKITDVKTASVMIKYPAHLVKIETDSGLYGIREAYNRDGILDHIRGLKNTVIGEDPLQVDFLYTKMLEAQMGHGSWTGSLSGAIAGIETALWDLAGKILNVPTYVLLGGKFRDKVLIYHDTGSPKTPDPAAWVEEAEKSLSFGFKATKFDMDWEGRGLFISGKGARYRQELWNRGITTIEMEQWVKILEAVRKRLGEHYPLGIDLHFNYNYADAMARYTRECKIPTVTGENLYSRDTFRPFIEKQACDIIQPDPQ